MTAKDSAEQPDHLVDERRYSRRLPDALDPIFTRTIDGVEFEVRWSGQLERLGLCEGLSRYEGHSDVHRAMSVARNRESGPVD
jgi:hypothetical protein